MKNLTRQNPRQLIVAQELINKVKSKCCGIKVYKKFGVRVRAKKNILTGDIDKSTLSLVELLDYQPKFDEDYLMGLIHKATPKWRGINADEWLNNVRGGIA